MMYRKQYALETPPAEFQVKKRLPYTIVEVKDPGVIHKWRHEVEERSYRNSQIRREKAIHALVTGPAPKPIIKAEPKQSFWSKAWNGILNAFLNIQYPG